MGSSQAEKQFSFRTSRKIRRLMNQLVDQANYDFGLKDGKFNLQLLCNALVLHLASLGPADRRALLEAGLRLLEAEADPADGDRSAATGSGPGLAPLDNPESLRDPPRTPRANKGGA